MLLTKRSIPLASGALVLAPFAALIALSFSTSLQAQGGNDLVPLADADLDGLDDGMEMLLHTQLNSADTDGDGLSDLEEVLLGTDPRTFSTVPQDIQPRVHSSLYAMDGRVIVQLTALYRHEVRWNQLLWVTDRGSYSVPKRQIQPFVADISTRDASQGGFKIQTIRLDLPRQVFDSQPSMAIAVTASVDGTAVGDAIHLMHDGPNLAVVGSFMGTFFGVEMQGQGGGTGGQGPFGGSGGVFPVEPEEPEPNRSEDSVCVQSLVVTGSAGPGIVTYEVVAAECVDLDEAVCISTCAATVGQTIPGIDILGLLGQ